MIAAFDLDGTLLKSNSSYIFCRFLRAKKVFSRSDLLFCSFTYLRHLYFGLTLRQVHSIVFERLFKGRNIDDLIPFLDEFLKKQLQKYWYGPALFRLERLKKRGAKIMVLSNSPRFIVEPIARLIGVESVLASEYDHDEEGKLTGIAHLLDGYRKAEVLKKMNSQNSIAFSDSHLDLPFLESAHRAVAVNPMSRLRKIARQRGWEIL